MKVLDNVKKYWKIYLSLIVVVLAVILFITVSNSIGAVLGTGGLLSYLFNKIKEKAKIKELQETDANAEQSISSSKDRQEKINEILNKINSNISDSEERNKLEMKKLDAMSIKELIEYSGKLRGEVK